MPIYNKFYENNSNIFEKEILLLVLHILVIYNATNLGWDIEKIGYNKYKFSKYIEDVNNFELDDHVDSILQY